MKRSPALPFGRVLRKTVLLNLCDILTLHGYTQFTLASLFTGNMVLHQNAEAALWGWAGPGKCLKGVGAESPSYDTLVVANGIAEVKCKNAPNWLTSYGKELALFKIAGKDGQFYPARAAIQGSSVMVSSPMAKEPLAVHYAFRDYTNGESFNTKRLPVFSFRTDNRY